MPQVATSKGNVATGTSIFATARSPLASGSHKRTRDGVELSDAYITELVVVDKTRDQLSTGDLGQGGATRPYVIGNRREVDLDQVAAIDGDASIAWWTTAELDTRIAARMGDELAAPAAPPQALTRAVPAPTQDLAKRYRDRILGT